MDDKRRSSPRKRTLLQGRIVFNDRFSLIECVVRDLSATGARIAFPHLIEIPPEFELEIPKKSLSLRSRLMWSNGKEHGVMFASAPAARKVEDGSDLGTLSAPPGANALGTTVQRILDKARHRIAQELGVHADAISLRVEVDRRSGTNEQ
jgi:hypothetical protein